MSAETQETRINDTVQELMFKFYPLAPILNNIRFKMSDKLPTAAVDANGRGLFNPSFAETLSDSELRFVIAHEALHVLLCHHKRSQKIAHVDNRLFNIAADCYINENLKSSTSFMAPEGLVDYELISKQLGEDYSYTTMLEESTEDLYDRLAANGDENNGSGSGSSDGNGDGNSGSSAGDDSESESGDDASGSGSGDGDESESGSGSGSGNTLDGDIQQDGVISEAYGDASEQESDQMDNAVKQAGKRLKGVGNGVGNGGDFDIVSKALSVDAAKILSKFTYKVSGRSTVCHSYRRPSRRYREIYPISAGKTRRAKRDIVFSIDVSGSMDAEKISKAVAFLVSLGREFTVGSKFMFFNSRHTDIYEFKSMEDFRKKLMASYGGGTSLGAALYDDKIDESADGVVLISDMEFSEKISDDLLSSRIKCPYMLVGVDVTDPSALDVKRDNVILF